MSRLLFIFSVKIKISPNNQENRGLDYLRARYLDINSGRFYGRDPFEGILTDPLTLTPYPYVKGNPVNFVDPNGNFGIGVSISFSIQVSLINVQTSFATAGLSAVGKVNNIASDVLQLSYTMQSIGLANIGEPGGIEIYNAGRAMTVLGYGAIGAAIAGIYVDTAKGTLKSMLKLKIKPYIVVFNRKIDNILEIKSLGEEIGGFIGEVSVAINDDFTDTTRVNALVDIGKRLLGKI